MGDEEEEDGKGKCQPATGGSPRGNGRLVINVQGPAA